MSISVVYWSGTGNTQAMAEAVAEGIKAAGQEAELLEVGNADAATVAAGNAFALGCPSMGAEQLEESRDGAVYRGARATGVRKEQSSLFGSYGWGRRRMDAGLGRTHEKCRRSACCARKASSQMSAPDR